MKLEDLSEQQREKISEFGVNTWYVVELLSQYAGDPDSVSEKWRSFFESLSIETTSGKPTVNGSQNPQTRMSVLPNISDTSKSDTAKPDSTKSGTSKQITSKPEVKLPLPAPGEDAVPIRGVGAKIIENMNSSLTIPTATSLRTIPMKVLEENRRLINNYFQKIGQPKISFTHFIGWAIVKSIGSAPVMNYAYSIIDNESQLIRKPEINLGLAIDLEKKDGSHSLIVPNIKKADEMNFKQYFDAYNDLISRARLNKIEVPDFQGTTITLTNPGTIGTASSNPRLMVGQGAIVATGSIDYPVEYIAASKDMISKIGISKVMNITSTYDHRIIQGAESGMFLKKIHELLIGKENFYEDIFLDLKVPVKPVVWSLDTSADEFADGTNLKEIEKHAKVIQMINMFRVRGHLLANLDPLQPKAQYHAELDPVNYGLTVWDYDREFITDGLGGLRKATLRNILEMLHQTYCENIGVEYRHIQDPEEKHWLQNNMESVRNSPALNKDVKKNILYKLIQAENFEKFIGKKYLGHKRFSLEGLETIIPVIDFMLRESANDDVLEIMIGMAHRGRLNVLANIIGKSLYAIFSEFEDITDLTSTQGSGDVKYHLGATGIYKTIDDKEITVSIASNPSHLEFVNPVVEGIVRAKQKYLNDENKEKIIPLLLHGDAAFAGEGIVAETLNLSQLQGYSTGGTVHIIINNQIGFTTPPVDARSSQYATDVAKMVQAPIFHVNGDDPEAALWVMKLAYEYRMKFNKDVVIDIIGYRRLGHNETDEPAFTQPLMYKLIKDHPSVREIYSRKMIKEHVITEQELKEMEESVQNKMDTDYNKVQKAANEFKSHRPLAVSPDDIKAKTGETETGISVEMLGKVVQGLTTLPAEFTIHPKLSKFIEGRKDLIGKDVLVDWAFGEALAFGSLLLENIPVRLSGQDCARGTFSQRHVVLTDMDSGREYIPMNFITENQAKIEPLDSLLSEAAVLGFEYGYSIADPVTLVVWEAQFGDFANAAQVIIDNFIASSYSKWQLPNDVVMLLPHGQEGQGPEHSSARLERYLLLCADDNMYVCNPTTPAQYFHLLRRHSKSQANAPLIVMTPKSLLRHPDARSKKDEFINGKFNEILDDETVSKETADRIILTSGKVFYDALKYKRENNMDKVALVRIEQYYPFKEEKIKSILASYENAKDVIWLQEEPANMGAQTFLAMRLQRSISKKQNLSFVSRRESSSTAPGSNKKFQATQKELIERAFKG